MLFRAGASLNVYLNSAVLVDCKYYVVDGKYTVKNEHLARKYIESTL